MFLQNARPSTKSRGWKRENGNMMKYELAKLTSTDHLNPKLLRFRTINYASISSVYIPVIIRVCYKPRFVATQRNYLPLVVR